MSYFTAHCDTEAELHTIGALLCVLDEVATDHLAGYDTTMCSGIINLIRVVGERVQEVQKLHDLELSLQGVEKAL
ncbi:hypothetical protein [Paracoccus ravus]|uniref:hypothetical protein n=1 Tax=Paracoccus ravus TaxID=2447760 RepID=UPI00106F02BB|nr:hypothetical protein [Paracoccus ravus]